MSNRENPKEKKIDFLSKQYVAYLFDALFAKFGCGIKNEEFQPLSFSAPCEDRGIDADNLITQASRCLNDRLEQNP